MTNKYEALFKDTMSSKQVCHSYFQLVDTVKIGSEDDKMLEEAFVKANKTAIARDLKQAREIEKNSKTESMNCILCD